MSLLIGSLVYWLSEALNRRQTPVRLWLLHRLSVCRDESVRRSAAWIIDEQVSPSLEMLDWETRLAQDSADSVRIEAAEGILTHVALFDDLRLASVVASLQEVRSFDWEGHLARQERFQETVTELVREAELRTSEGRRANGADGASPWMRLPVEDILGAEAVRLIQLLSLRDLGLLSHAVWDRWYDVWVEQEESTPATSASVEEIRQRLQDLGARVPLIRVSSEEDLFAAIEAQLDPLWAADQRVAARVYAWLWLWMGELQRQKMTRLHASAR